MGRGRRGMIEGMVPKFSIKALLIATALVAVGLTIAFLLFRPWLEPYGRFIWPIRTIFYFGGFALAGAGLMYPFKKLKLGAWLGALMGLLYGLTL